MKTIITVVDVGTFSIAEEENGALKVVHSGGCPVAGDPKENLLRVNVTRGDTHVCVPA